MINIKILTQPTDETCGATCLHAIYQYYGLTLPLQDVVNEVERSHSGGTLAPMLGIAALKQGFDADIYINNLMEFDPTWFKHGIVDNQLLIDKLKEQLLHKRSKGIVQLSHAFIRFLELNGKVRFHAVDVPLLKQYFEQEIPIIVGLNSTYLYQCARETFEEGKALYDDVRGSPCGHFIVLCGYDETHRRIVIADPHKDNPLTNDNYYKVNSHQLINAILLGVQTYDAQLLIITPKK